MMVKNTGLRVIEFNDGVKIDIGFPGDRRSGLFWGKHSLSSYHRPVSIDETRPELVFAESGTAKGEAHSCGNG